MEWSTSAGDWLTRLVFQRALAFIYFLGFLIAANQFRPLVGEHGLVPVPLFLSQVKFWQAPSLFWLRPTDGFFGAAAWLGVALSLGALLGLSDAFGMAVSFSVWFSLWLLYLSFVNVGQVFYGFGWETLLLETGFLAIFLGPSSSAPPKILFWLLRWLLFRVMFGAGMIKLRGDPCWRDLTCLQYHYETQPMPNPLSWYFHQLPALFHKASVLFTHFVELVVPWGYFIPGPISYIAGGITILFQLTLILSGNLSWLNYITLVLCLPCFDDALLSRILAVPPQAAVTLTEWRRGLIYALTALILYLSIRPALNLFSASQKMNASFDPLHLVNTYGAFGSIGRIRDEVILEGTYDDRITALTRWQAYEFKGKPGRVDRRPPIVSPYHYRLDWQMWFAAMSSYEDHPWILNLIAKLLAGDSATLALLGPNPFAGQPPKYIRAVLYRYSYTSFADKTNDWWKRQPLGGYLPPLSLKDPAFRKALRRMGWETGDRPSL